MFPNRLSKESSLYLRQHADNPVDWYPWGTEALDKAKQEKKPILLSIGYSACHWCHVMAAESFADEETAKLMNELFINIKVDREQRPDLDKIYQTTQQLLTGRTGGWPLTVFLNPENLMPFFAGTYFPPRAGLGMPSFKMVLQKVAGYFHENMNAIVEQNIQLGQALTQLASFKIASEDELSEKPLEQAIKYLISEFDSIHGGFGTQPKFPHPTNLSYLLDYGIGGNHENIINMVVMTLEQMAKGGIYDQLGGGFYRYSVDAAWQIPHFEKMLYDNAQLLGSYATTLSQIYPNQYPLFVKVTQETAEWILREMTAPEGGFYATLDADSEHQEGKFYYWDKEEAQSLLSPEEYAIIESHYGFNKAPNFEAHWHLQVETTIEKLAKKFNTDENSVEKIIESARKKLLLKRDQRVRPGRDEKIIIAWNGLMIKGMALAGLYLQREDFIHSAQKAVDFIYEDLWRDQHLIVNGQTGFLDDYAFLLEGLLTLLQVEWRTKDLNFAVALAESLLNYFEDKMNGGFFFTAIDQEQLIQRPKPLMDEAIPSGNGIAARSLLHLGHLLGDERYLHASERTVQMSWDALNAYPQAHCTLLQVLDEILNPPQIIILRGSKDPLTPWKRVCQEPYVAKRLVFAIPETEVNLPGILDQQIAGKNKITGYICNGQQCLAPINDFAEFERTLKK